MAEELSDDRIAIYEFLLKCKPKYEEDGEYLSDGTMNNLSTYYMQCKEDDMWTLAYDLGVTGRPGENAWEAIERFMEHEIHVDKKETAKTEA